MPGMSGPELKHELKRRRLVIPAIVVTAQKDETVRSCMFAGGAVECLFKPLSEYGPVPRAEQGSPKQI